MANDEAMTNDIANLSKAEFFLHFLNMTITESNSLGHSHVFTPETFLDYHMLDIDDAMHRVVEIGDRLIDQENDESEQWVNEVTYEMELIGSQLSSAGEAFMKIASMFEQFSEEHSTFAFSDE